VSKKIDVKVFKNKVKLGEKPEELAVESTTLEAPPSPPQGAQCES
jgi:hypothetical protein